MSIAGSYHRAVGVDKWVILQPDFMNYSYIRHRIHDMLFLLRSLL